MMRRALHVSHTGMTEPLGRSQVLPYVRGLARAGWDIDIVAFEPPSSTASAIASLRDELERDQIGYHPMRRSGSHGLPIKMAEFAQAFARLAQRALIARPHIVHARSYLPAAAASVLRSVFRGARFIFDCRGLLGDEYVDAGHWSGGSARYRLVKRVERRLFAHADAVVTLTERLQRWLFDERWVGRDIPVEVIPCCVDIDRFCPDPALRARTRSMIDAKDRFVLVYAGSLGSWYCEEEMAQLFAALQRRRPALFVVLTRNEPARLRAALRTEGVADADVAVIPTEPADMPRMLAGADASVCFITPCFSKMASSPTKIAEYLAMGLPVAMNRGVGDGDLLLSANRHILADAGTFSRDDVGRAGDRLIELAEHPSTATAARALAEEQFGLERVGIARYRRLYEMLAS